MKWFLFLAMVMIISSCGSGEEKTNTSDSANMLNDTLPAVRPADSLLLDSNPSNQTKLDTGKGDFN